jgi:IclR family KDG regulon transcriptional repressor
LIEKKPKRSATMKTIEKAFDILEIIMDHGGPMTVSEIARLSGVNSSSVCRVCAMLTSRDYLYQSTKRGPYSLGPKFLQFNDVTNLTTKLKNKAYPFLNELSQKVNENVLMSVPSGPEIVTIVVINPDKIIQAHAHEGDRVPLFCTGIGKVILANKSTSEINRLYSKHGLKAYTRNTITDLNRLNEEMEKIKTEGVSINDQEYEQGLRAIAAPIKDGKGKVIAGISIVGSTITITEDRINTLIPIVKEYATNVSRALGYKGK